MKYTEIKFLDRLFRISIFIKGVDSLLETIGGFLLLILSPSAISGFVKLILQHELLEDPNDFIGNLIVNLSAHLSASAQLYGAIYLISHGIIKLALIIGLWKRKLWTYILAEIVFTIFIIYQVYNFAFSHSILLLVLTLLDMLIVALTWWEYKRLKRKRDS